MAVTILERNKQELAVLQVADPITIDYGKSVWLSSLRSNEEVTKWPYKKSMCTIV
jgi:hypothetical protein